MTEAKKKRATKRTEAYPLMITAIRVYGSYPTDKDPLGDIDIAVEYKEREPYASKRGWEVRLCHKVRRPSCRRLHSKER